MSKTISVESSDRLKEFTQSFRLFLVIFYSEQDAASKAITNFPEQLSTTTSIPDSMKFAKVDVAVRQEIADEYQITTIPSFVYFKNGKVVDKVQGVNAAQLTNLMRKIKTDAEGAKSNDASSSSGGGSSSANWRGAELPRGYGDITSQIELQRCELLNVDSEGGSVRVLFDSSKPSTLSGGKATAKDWVESDTDEQLMLFMPFQSVLKLHTLQITSLPPQDDDDDEAPMRPRTIKLFSNKPHNLGFDEAEDMASTQTIELSEKDWSAEGTASIPLRYVKFQNVTSLVMFVVNGDGDSEKVRLDRLRLIGEAGEKREMGKLEKIGDGSE
ncbi:PITH domain-containing protein [Cercophora newfieldiana]|uniref:PITH domain-containing protein n=1 Tax=Cercophora newfieldiana TaxID=92897 RepID=A0AA40D004_9PEZI|nr:PITH domain-containing protein [Cercophora newfieldiana]